MSSHTTRTPGSDRRAVELDAHLDDVPPWGAADDRRERQELAQALAAICERTGAELLNPDSKVTVEISARLLVDLRDLTSDAVADHEGLAKLRRARVAARAGDRSATRAALLGTARTGRPPLDDEAALQAYRWLTTEGPAIVDRQSGERLTPPLSKLGAVEVIVRWYGYGSADACIRALMAARPKRGQAGFVALPARGKKPAVILARDERRPQR